LIGGKDESVDVGGVVGEWGDVDIHVGEEREGGQELVQFVVATDVEYRVVRILPDYTPDMGPSPVTLE
jgi:hypothetical protein